MRHCNLFGFDGTPPKLVAHTVDFADSQQNAIKRAFGMVFLEIKGFHVNTQKNLAPEKHKEFLNKMALEKGHQMLLDGIFLILGCLFHWDQSVKRVAENASAVPIKQRSKFKSMIRECREAATADEFRKLAAKIRRAFPEAKSGFDWWLNPQHGSLILESMKPVPQHQPSCELVDRTNNGAESNNRDQKRCFQQGLTWWRRW